MSDEELNHFCGIVAVYHLEPLIATAIESATGCRLENGVLYLEYPHPSVNDFVLKDSRHKLNFGCRG